MTTHGHYRIAFPEDVARRIGLASRRLMDGIVADAVREATRRGETLQAPADNGTRYGSEELDDFFAMLERTEKELMAIRGYEFYKAKLEERLTK